MYNLGVIAENLQSAAIQRRRQLDEQRKKIIFNPRVRILGVDLKALDDQVKIKKSMMDGEAKRNSEFNSAINDTNQILELMQDQVDESRKHERKELETFRREKQKIQNRRDFDLYDPDKLKKDFPARKSDDDERCGISGMQMFEGEDLAFKKRIQLQKEQMKTWTLEQIYEKERKAHFDFDETRRYAELQKNISNKMALLEDAVKNARFDQAKQDSEYNQFLASEKHRRELQRKQREAEEDLKELTLKINGAFLTENPDCFKIGGSHKVQVDQYKGMLPHEKLAIFNQQKEQRKEAEARREDQREKERLWALQTEANSRTLALLERERIRKNREHAIQIRRENESKALEDKKRNEFIDKVLYTNPPSNAYFDQFNTTSR